MTIKELFSTSESESIISFEKKHISFKENNKSTIAIGAFTVLFFFSISLAILNKPTKEPNIQTQYKQQEELVEINSPIPYPETKQIVNTESLPQLAQSVFNYSHTFKNTQHLQFSLKPNSEGLIDLNNIPDTLNVSKNTSLEIAGNDFNLVKEQFILEDLMISPFKSGTVTSKIISFSESSNLFSVELLKTYTYKNETMTFIELKVFNKANVSFGNFKPIQNILSIKQK